MTSVKEAATNPLAVATIPVSTILPPGDPPSRDVVRTPYTEAASATVVAAPIKASADSDFKRFSLAYCSLRATCAFLKSLLLASCAAEAAPTLVLLLALM